MAKSLSYMETTTVLNQNGEVKEQAVTKSYKPEVEPNYIKLYLDDIAILYNIDIKSDILFELLKYVTYEHELFINKPLKERIAKKIDKSLSYVNNSITKLVKNEVLIREANGLYLINSFLLGKGSWRNIYKHRKEIEIRITYGKDGRKVKEVKEVKEVEEDTQTESMNNPQYEKEIGEMLENF